MRTRLLGLGCVLIGSALTLTACPEPEETEDTDAESSDNSESSDSVNDEDTDESESGNLECSGLSVADNHSVISGRVDVDAYFSGVVVVRAAVVQELEPQVRDELESLAFLVGLDPEGIDTPELAALISAAINAEIAAHVEGDFGFESEGPKCLVVPSRFDAALFAEQCNTVAGPVAIGCEGTCAVVDEGDCAGALSCVGNAPEMMCAGTCVGQCELEVASVCTGICEGECMGTCTNLDIMDNCAGTCEGLCQGTCILDGGGSCDGACQGSCAWEPGGQDCGNATPHCSAPPAVSPCAGGCDGRIAVLDDVPPTCEVGTVAQADAQRECESFGLTPSFQFSGLVDEDAADAFNERAEDWGDALVELDSALLALTFLSQSSADLIAAANGSAPAYIEQELADPDVGAEEAVGLTCALAELSIAIAVATEAQTIAEANIAALEQVIAALGG